MLLTVCIILSVMAWYAKGDQPREKNKRGKSVWRLRNVLSHHAALCAMTSYLLPLWVDIAKSIYSAEYNMFES